MPQFTRNEKILLRTLERKDLFEERFPKEPVEIDKESIEETASDFHSVGEGSIVSHQQGLVSSSSSIRHASGDNRPGTIRQGSSTSSQRHLATPQSKHGRLTPDTGYAAEQPKRRGGLNQDTHFFDTEARFKKITVPIRIPMTSFDEDVGEVSANDQDGADNSILSSSSSRSSRILLPFLHHSINICIRTVRQLTQSSSSLTL